MTQLTTPDVRPVWWPQYAALYRGEISIDELEHSMQTARVESGAPAPALAPALAMVIGQIAAGAISAIAANDSSASECC